MPVFFKYNRMKDKLMSFVAKVEQELINGKSYNKPSIEELAAAFGITDKTEVKELTELAIVNRARAIAHEAGTVKENMTG